MKEYCMGIDEGKEGGDSSCISMLAIENKRAKIVATCTIWQDAPDELFDKVKQAFEGIVDEVDTPF